MMDNDIAAGTFNIVPPKVHFPYYGPKGQSFDYGYVTYDWYEYDNAQWQGN